MEEREVEVHAFDLLNAADLLDGGEPLLRLHVECGSGTYVRSLVRDLGELLGCGAHVAELRRLWVDPFREPRMWTLEGLEQLREQAGERVLDACLLPIEAGMASWPEVRVNAAQAQRLGRGQGLRGPYPPRGRQVAILDEQGRGLGLGEVDTEGGLRPTRLFRWAAIAGAAEAHADALRCS
ncbi:tRNA pseudouridine(55) synthase TruB [Thermomonas sp. S9]|nr:tRNA pseudouridine(55) synthase TruB [Thermomonas sp. S9]